MSGLKKLKRDYDMSFLTGILGGASLWFFTLVVELYSKQTGLLLFSKMSVAIIFCILIYYVGWKFILFRNKNIYE